MKTVFLKLIFVFLITLLPELAGSVRFQKRIQFQKRKLSSLNANCVCGKNDPLGTRIVGGVVADPHEFPWQAMLFLKNKPYCGASVINERYVLTAGHCGINFQAADVSVMIGVNDWLYVSKLAHRMNNIVNYYKYGVSEIIVHPNFKSHENHDIKDIALMKLNRTIIFNENVQPVCLPQKDETFDGKMATISGWGKTKEDGKPTQYLTYAHVRVLTETACLMSRLGSHVSEDSNSMFCAYALHKDACQGDSGGPLVYRNRKDVSFQIGIISWGERCALKDYPGIYTRVTEFRDWILKNTQDVDYCAVPN